MYHAQLVAAATSTAMSAGELPSMSDDELALGLAFFAHFDTDQDGLLREDEFRPALEAAARHGGQRFLPYEIKSLWLEAADAKPERCGATRKPTFWC